MEKEIHFLFESLSHGEEGRSYESITGRGRQAGEDILCLRRGVLINLGDYPDFPGFRGGLAKRVRAAEVRNARAAMRKATR